MTEVSASQAFQERLALASLADGDFVDAIFALFLRRSPEPHVRDELAGRLCEGTLSRAALIRDLASSDEFVRVREIDDAVAAALARAREQTDDEFLDETYRLLLRRAPDSDARDAVLRELGGHATSRASVLAGVVASAEYDRLFQLDDAITRALAYGRTGGRLRELTGPPGSDERVVEIPWAFSRYHGGRRVLDVGYANAEPDYVAALVSLAPELLVGVDLAAVDVLGMTTVVADVRALPFDAEAFDVVFCISTLEHVGKDNSVYGAQHERDPEGIPQALGELRRILGRRGRLLLSVPAGAEEDHEWFVQRDPAVWRGLFARAGFDVLEHELYELFDHGWRSVARVTDGLRYGERGPGASAVLCAELRPRRLRPRVPAALRLGRAG
jgi:SAM-dependent methyltransferase